MALEGIAVRIHTDEGTVHSCQSKLEGWGGRGVMVYQHGGGQRWQSTTADDLAEQQEHIVKREPAWGNTQGCLGHCVDPQQLI